MPCADNLRLPCARYLQVNPTLERLKMSKQPKAPNRPTPASAPRPTVPNLPSKTGNKSGDGRGNYPPKKQ